MQSPPIFLVGYMGSGKSTLGRKLARKLGRKFVDLDQEISGVVQQSIPAYFEAFGEEAFRKIESEVLRALDFSTPTIIATGGGAPCFLDNMQWMKSQGAVVYLKLSPRALWSRLLKTDLGTRPILQGKNDKELLSFIEEKLNLRAPFYEQAQIHVNPQHLGVQEVINEITNQLQTYDRNS